MKKMARHLLTFIIILCVAAAAYMGWKIIQTQLEYRRGEEGLEAIYQVMEEAVPIQIEEENGEEEQEEPWEVRRQRYMALYEQNQDVCGWIRVKGTVIDYPVMHTPEDPEYYFHRDFEGNYSSYGMIFIDGDCRLDGTSPNLLIYGHHMRNGSMFAAIEDYDNTEFWPSHPQIQFDTLEEAGIYEVIAAFKLPAAQLDEDFKTLLLAEDQEDFERLMEQLKVWRLYDTGVEAEWGDRLITLTTCEYTQADGRFFVVARKMDSQGEME